jgi:hypothetical protein
MGPCEQQVTKIIKDSVDASPTMLAINTVLDDPERPLTPDELFELLLAEIRGLRRAVCYLARQMDET